LIIGYHPANSILTVLWRRTSSTISQKNIHK